MCIAAELANKRGEESLARHKKIVGRIVCVLQIITGLVGFTAGYLALTGG